MTSPANASPLPMNAPKDPPAVLSAAQRHDLARQFERAKQALRRNPPDFAGAHLVLSDCCTLDPGNTLFVQALLENLLRAKGKTKTAWPWQLWQRRAALQADLRDEHWSSALRHGWFLLGQTPSDIRLLGELAEICARINHGPSRVVLLREAYRWSPNDPAVATSLAIALGEAGQFAAAAPMWRRLAHQQPANEQAALLAKLFATAEEETPAETADNPPTANLADQVAALLERRQWSAAEKTLAAGAGAAGNDLRLRELGEEIMLARAREKTSLAQRQNELLPTKRAAELIAEIFEEQRRVELGVAFARYERFSSEPAAAWELASSLTRAGNYSEALKYLDALQQLPAWRLKSLVASGENWQQLRQFPRALELYRQAAELPQAEPGSEDWSRACYRVAVLAEASGSPVDALGWLERLVATNPTYKDAGARLDNLRAICDKGGFSVQRKSG